MDATVPETVRYSASASAAAPPSDGFQNVHDLERALLEATRSAGRELYVQAFAAFQEAWLAQRRPAIQPNVGAPLQWLAPFGPVQLPVRVVQEKASGDSLTLSKVFLRLKATCLPAGRPGCSPQPVEQAACAAATEQNDRPAARSPRSVL